MRRLTLLTLATILGASGVNVASGSDQSSATRTVTQSYIAPTPFVLPGCDYGKLVDVPMRHLVGNRWTAGSADGSGGTCFAVQGDDLEVALQIDDASSLPVAGTAYFRTANGAYIHGYQIMFCGTATMEVPPTAGILYVSAESSAYACTLHDVLPASPATVGTITAVFSR